MTDQLQIYNPLGIMRRDLVEGLAETAAANRQYLEDFEARAFPFFDALHEVKQVIFAIKMLSVANGGDATARAFAECSDALVSALNGFDRQAKAMSENPFASVDFTAIQELGRECNALRTLANTYAMAEPAARSALQRRIATAIADAEPLVATLLRSRRRHTEETRIVAQMLVDLRSRGESWKVAIHFIREHHPAIYRSYFTHTTQKGRVDYAKSLVRSLEV